MVGRLAGRLVISGGRITTGTTPEVMEEEVACGGMRGACGIERSMCGKQCRVYIVCGNMRGTCGNMWGTWGT